MTRACYRAGAILALSLLVGCGNSDATDETGPSVSDEGEDAAVLHLPLEPQTHLTSRLIGFSSDEIIDDGLSSLVVVPEARRVDLALGDGYPEVLNIELEQLAGGSACRLHGEPRITRVTGGGDAASATQVDASTIRLQRGVEGAAAVTVSGHFEPDRALMSDDCRTKYQDYVEFRFELEFEVRTHQLTGVALGFPRFCEQSSRPLFFPGDKLTGMTVQLVGGDGERFTPANATSSRPATLTVTAPEGAEVSISSDVRALRSVQLPEVAGTVEIAPAVGSSHQVEVVEATRVTAVEVAFDLPGFYTDPVVLESGGTYGNTELTDIGDRVVASLVPPAYIDGEPVCSDPPTRLFELSSATPEVCRVERRPHFKLKAQEISGWPVDDAANLLKDGTCQLQLQSTEINNGQGLSAELQATFVSVDMLTNMGGLE